MSLVKNSFIRSVAVLVTGTTIAQGIGYLIAPILTRLYTAEEMGELNVYMRAVGFIAAMATVRYELTLPLPKRDSHSYLLYRLSLRLAMLILLGVGVLSFLYFASNGFGSDNVLFISMTVISALFLVFINLGTNWSIRTASFKMISRSRVVNSLTANSLRWGFGLLQWGGLGLILATTIGYFLASLEFVREWFKINRLFKTEYSGKKTYALGMQYREFPLINLPHTLVDVGRDLIVAVLVIAFFAKDTFGYYSHSYAMLRIPVAIIGASIGQVLFNRCSEILNQGRSVSQLVQRTTFGLLALSVMPFILIFFYGEAIFAFVFGLEWSESGTQAEIMAPWLLLSFVASSISTLPAALLRQKEFFLLSLIGTILQLIGFGLLPWMFETEFNDFSSILYFVTYSQAIYLIVTILATLYYASKGQKSISVRRK